MSYEIAYNICIIVSCMLEIYLALSFLGSFHELRPTLKTVTRLYAAYIGFVGINIAVNFQHNNMMNLFCATFLYLFMALVMFSGHFWSRVAHWLILIFLGASSEMIFSLLLSLPVYVPVDKAFENTFFMISGMLAVKLIYFLLLSLVKQFSRYSTEKLDLGLFANYVIVPVATLGVMFAIPYVRGGRDNTIMDFILILFYILLLSGNVSLFYMFCKYSKMKEQQMVQQISKTKYEEVKKQYDRMEHLDEKYKEMIHNMNHYLRQIGIYANENELRKIQDLLSELSMGMHLDEQEMLCANGFLNAMLTDFRDRARKARIDVDVFVENGFQIEFMKEIELTTVLGNLLDNAMEAAQHCENAKVCIALFMQNGGKLSVLRIENTFQSPIKKMNGKLVSTKTDTRRPHGIGIKSVENVVQKYHGYMQQNFSEGVFETRLVSPVRG